MLELIFKFVIVLDKFFKFVCELCILLFFDFDEEGGCILRGVRFFNFFEEMGCILVLFVKVDDDEVRIDKGGCRLTGMLFNFVEEEGILFVDVIGEGRLLFGNIVEELVILGGGGI